MQHHCNIDVNCSFTPWTNWMSIILSLSCIERSSSDRKVAVLGSWVSCSDNVHRDWIVESCNLGLGTVWVLFLWQLEEFWLVIVTDMFSCASYCLPRCRSRAALLHLFVDGICLIIPQVHHALHSNNFAILLPYCPIATKSNTFHYHQL